MCGGTEGGYYSYHDGQGLSPRVRGNLKHHYAPAVRGRSIPACAGEPRRPSRRRESNTVYPRVCGGTPAASTTVTSSYGLSPRVRGNPCQHRGLQVNRRSIPACAGEPRSLIMLTGVSGVYPRVCGGTPGVLTGQAAVSGLSPRVRGNPVRECTGQSQPGSIPACAGEPHDASHWRRRHRVYPRVCGGTSPRRSSSWPSAGLSPRVRGNHAQRAPERGQPGSIPACAGEPRPSAQCHACGGVYPRVCGGTPALSP